MAGSDLDAFRRHRGEGPAATSPALVRALDELPASDDPAVAFARLAAACVPVFADGCGIEISDSDQPPLRTVFPAGSPSAGRSLPSAELAGPEQILHTPFRVPSQSGYPPYAGVLTHWWISRRPAEADAVVADLMVRHVVALVHRERLTQAIGRSDGRAADLALEAISGRTINMAIGIVMHQRALSAENAEALLRRSGAATGSSLYEMATYVVRHGALADPAPGPARPRKDPGPRDHLRPVDPIGP